MALTVTTDKLPYEIDLPAYQGDDWFVSFIISDVDDTDPDLPVVTPRDLTGSTGKMQIRDAATSAGTIILTPTFDGTNLATGVVLFKMTNVTMETAAAGDFFYDLEITDLLGIRTTWMKGKFTIEAQITTDP